MIRAATIALLTCLPLGAMADEVSVFGIWCGPQGDALEISAESLASFEHTVCEFDTEQPATREFSTDMICRSIHFDDEFKPIVTQENRYSLTAKLLTDDQIELDYHDGDEPYVLTRCDDEMQ